LRPGFLPLILPNATPGTHRSPALRWVFSFLMSPWALCAPAALLLVVYWPGLDGPLMLDDAGSLTPIVDWLEGRSSALEVLLGNISGPTGRPLAMASFLLNAAIGGDSVWALKFGNLLLHGLTGLVVWRVSHLLLRAAGITPAYWPLLVTSIWLLHPLQLSTVLYTVQRMTQLAALFSLLAILAWFKARDLYLRNELPAARLWLFVAMPLFTLFAVLGKENGVLAPILCVALDLALFGWRGERHREQRLMMQVITAGATLVLTAVLLSGYGDRLLAAYGIRDYSPLERVMTQMRVLWHYVGQILWPDVASLGLYHDAFPPSRGWVQPLSTLLGLLAWIVFVLFALIARTRLPLFAGGLGLFLLGHALEASPLNLELYFEHRNYLPMFGLLLAAVALLHRATPAADTDARRALLLTALLVPALAWATADKATVWSSPLLTAEQALRSHPDSIRAHVDYAIAAVEAGRTDEAERVLQQLSQLNRPEARKVGLLFELGTACYVRGDADPAKLQQLHALADGKHSLFQASAFDMLASKFDAAGCGRLKSEEVSGLALRFAKAGAGPEPIYVTWRLRRAAARLLLAEGKPAEAAAALQPAWSNGIRDPESIYVYALALGDSGRADEALHVLNSMLGSSQSFPRDWKELMLELRRRLR
jgi:tetratricopeptide (TPR) repeat protein